MHLSDVVAVLNSSVQRNYVLLEILKLESVFWFCARNLRLVSRGCFSGREPKNVYGKPQYVET